MVGRLNVGICGLGGLKLGNCGASSLFACCCGSAGAGCVLADLGEVLENGRENRGRDIRRVFWAGSSSSMRIGSFSDLLLMSIPFDSMIGGLD